MADNVAITAGAGTSVATDDVSGVHYQKVKLYTAEADSAEGIGDDDQGATRSMWATLRRKITEVEVDSSGLTTSATAYAAGDMLGAGWTLAGMARASGGTGRILSVTVLDKGDVALGLDVFFTQSAVTFGTDNSAPSISDADAAKIVGFVGLAMYDVGGARFAHASNLLLPYLCEGGTSLFAYARTRDAHTFFSAATDLRLKIFAELD